MSRTPPKLLRTACEILQLSVQELWIDYMSLGGNLAFGTIEAFLLERIEIGDHDFDIVIQALNDRFLSRGDDHPLPYADEPPLTSL